MSNSKGGLLVPVIAAVALLLLGATMAGLFSHKIMPTTKEIAKADTATALPAILQAGPTTEAVPASVEAKQSTVISSRLLARIVAVNVRAGDYVVHGQVLVELEKTDLLARADQAAQQIRSVEARLTEAHQNLARAEELHQRGLIAIADRDAARADAAALEADLASANQALTEAQTAVSYSELRSPIAGRVVDRFAEPGDTVSPGGNLLSLYNPFSLRVEARVREQLALTLTTGQALAVRVPALEKSYTAVIEDIVPAAHPGSRSFLIKAMLPSEPGLLPGMYARLQVPAGDRSRLLIPLERVAQAGQLDVVWVVSGGQVLRRFVRLGQPADNGLVEVLSGLEAGDELMPVP